MDLIEILIVKHLTEISVPNAIMETSLMEMESANKPILYAPHSILIMEHVLHVIKDMKSKEILANQLKPILTVKHLMETLVLSAIMATLLIVMESANKPILYAPHLILVTELVPLVIRDTKLEE